MKMNVNLFFSYIVLSATRIFIVTFVEHGQSATNVDNRLKLLRYLWKNNRSTESVK